VTAWVLRRRLAWAALVPCGLLAAGVGLFWYVRNLAVYGAPFWPFYRQPFGKRLPTTITEFGTSFLHSARATLHVVTLHGYVISTGGGLVLLAGAASMLLLGPAIRERPIRWAVLALAVVSVLEFAIWMAAPFTGYGHKPHTIPVVDGAPRYLLPGFSVMVACIALATRARGLVRWLAVGLLAFALGVDCWSMRRYAHPYYVSIWIVVGALAAGAVAGWVARAAVAGAAGRRARRARPGVGLAALGIVVCLAAAAAFTATENGYLGRELVVNPQTRLDATPPVVFLMHQPGFRTGHTTVAEGPDLDAYLSGPTFNHPTVLIPASATCAQVRADARTEWLVLAVVPPPGIFGVVYNKTDCLTGVRPAFAIGTQQVYRPGS
jgi:hypothetical protein